MITIITILLLIMLIQIGGRLGVLVLNNLSVVRYSRSFEQLTDDEKKVIWNDYKSKFLK